jgi:hypothetical protein
VGSDLFFSNDLDTVLLGGSAELPCYPAAPWLARPESTDFDRYFRLIPETMGFLLAPYGKTSQGWPGTNYGSACWDLT